MTEVLKRDQCSSCHAPVIWCVLQNSTPIMVDYEPHPQGNVKIERRPFGLLASTVSAKLAFGRNDLRRAHFASCPHADQHRKARQRRTAARKRLGIW